MGLLRLLFRLDADASGLQTKLHQAKRSLTGFARRSMRDFRTAFTTFFSVSALKNLFFKAYEFADKYATDKEFQQRVKDLGVTIDDELVRNTRIAGLQLETLGYHMKTGLLTGINLVTPAIMALGKAAMNAGAFMGVTVARIERMPQDIADAVQKMFWDGVGALMSGRKIDNKLAKEIAARHKLPFFDEQFWKDLEQSFGDVDTLMERYKAGAAKVADQRKTEAQARCRSLLSSDRLRETT